MKIPTQNLVNYFLAKINSVKSEIRELYRELGGNCVYSQSFVAKDEFINGYLDPLFQSALKLVDSDVDFISPSQLEEFNLSPNAAEMLISKYC